MPPFPSFISKFLIIKAFFTIGLGWLAIPFFILLAVIMYGMGSTVFKMSFLPAEGVVNNPEANVNLKFTAYVPQIFLLVLLLVIGTSIPGNILAFIKSAALFLN